MKPRDKAILIGIAIAIPLAVLCAWLALEIGRRLT